LLVKGNQYIEVDGDQYVTVRGDRITKIQGSDIKEVKTDQNTNIEGEKHERVGKNRTEYIQGNHRENIQGLFVATTVDDWENIVKGNLKETVVGSDIRMADGKRGIGSGADIELTARETMQIYSKKDMDIDTIDGDITIKTVGSSDDIIAISGRNIHLNPD
jgi:hypothetical protein